MEIAKQLLSHRRWRWRDLSLTLNLFTFSKHGFRFFQVPVVRCGERCHDHIPPIDVKHICHSLQDVEVEMGVTRYGAVQSGLEKGGPLLLQDTGWAATVVLTNPGHPREHDLTKTGTAEGYISSVTLFFALFSSPSNMCCLMSVSVKIKATGKT